MATTIFLILNVLGLAFLLYVLVNFWKEGKRTRTDFRPDEYDFLREEKQSVLVVTHLIAYAAQRRGNVIPLRVRGQDADSEQDDRDQAGQIYEMKAERFSSL
jgi:hypothetical protein